MQTNTSMATSKLLNSYGRDEPTTKIKNIAKQVYPHIQLRTTSPALIQKNSSGVKTQDTPAADFENMGPV
jgi:hypothetical protein